MLFFQNMKGMGVSSPSGYGAMSYVASVTNCMIMVHSLSSRAAMPSSKQSAFSDTGDFNARRPTPKKKGVRVRERGGVM